MLVFHGTNCDIEEICLTQGSRYKDFGQGFYVTPDIETAKRMAKKKTNLFGGVPTIITYQFEDKALTMGELNVLEFHEKATAEWIHFINSNRSRNEQHRAHNFDIVKGPIADDGVALQLGRLRAHADSAEAIAIDLQDAYLDQQICFTSKRSLEYIKKLSVCQI